MEKKFIIEKEFVGIRLDKVLSILDNSFSRNKIQELIDEENVLVNNQILKSSYKVKENDQILVIDEEENIDYLAKEDIPLDIVYEDNDMLVINKKAGMVVHPANGHYSGTLVNALLYRFDKLSTLSGESRPGIVHRIDKETSGLLMVAKNNKAHESLQGQLKDKTAKRYYYALIQGEMPHNAGTISAPIGRDSKDRKKMMVRESGKDAVTNFEVIKRYNGYTLLSCSLETGRTHQIRVHLSTIKFPIVGDIIYGPKKPLYSNMLLHAYALEFIQPTTKEKIRVTCPLPDYYSEVLQNLDKFGSLTAKEKELWEQN